jgi:TatD DNase family protein
MLIDSHCHIDGEAFDADRDEVVARAKAAGVAVMLNVGTGDPHSEDFRKAVAVAERYENVFASVGVHPHDAKLYDDESEAHLVKLAKSEKVIAWGEIGLDYYYDHSPREVQQEVFRRQIRKAKELNLPIIVHSRDANEDTVQILSDAYAMQNSDKYVRVPTGIMHCFGGTPEMANALMDIGFLISFAGNVTFKKAENLRDAAKVVPLDKLLVETDCPFLTPEPNRGKRNEPAFVEHTAQFLAGFYGVEFETLASQTTKNFLDYFRLQI